MARSLGISLVLGMLLVTAEAAADPKPGYQESKVEGGSVVSFETDGLRGDGTNFMGETIRRPPGAVRVGLIRPRFNFVPEMLKSVENL